MARESELAVSSPGLPLRLFQHCLWKGTEVLWGPFATLLCARRLLPCSRCHMASFQRYAGKPERDGDRERDMVRPGELFYIIPRHNRANPDVHTLKQGGECVFSGFRFSRDFPAYRFNGEGKKKKKNSSRWFQVQSRGVSQPRRAIIIMNSGEATLHPDTRRNRRETAAPRDLHPPTPPPVPGKFGGSRICSAS